MIFFKGLFNSKFKGVLTAPGAAVSCPRALPLDLARALPVIFAPSQFFRLMKSDTLNFQRLKKMQLIFANQNLPLQKHQGPLLLPRRHFVIK